MELNLRLKKVTEEMLENALNGDWDKVDSLEKEQAELVKKINVLPKKILEDIFYMHQKIIDLSNAELATIKTNLSILTKKKDLAKVYF